MYDAYIEEEFQGENRRGENRGGNPQPHEDKHNPEFNDNIRNESPMRNQDDGIPNADDVADASHPPHFEDIHVMQEVDSIDEEDVDRHRAK